MVRAGLLVSITTILSRILGLARDSLIAVLFGAGSVTDAFFIALRIPNLFRRTVAEGSLATAAVPLLTRAKERGAEEFSRTLGAILSISVPIAGVLSVIGIVYSREITLLLSPGLGTELELVGSAERLLKILSPFVLIIAVTATLGSALNTVHRYLAPSLHSSINNLTLIAALGYGYLTETLDMTTVAWAFILGSLLALLPLVVQLSGLGLFPRLNIGALNRELKGFAPLFLPSFFAASAYQLLGLILALIASMLPVGTISCLYYADRIYQFPIGIFSIAIATAALPRLAELRSNSEAFDRQLTQLLRWITIGAIPAAVGIYVLALPVVRLLFEHGSFSPQDAAVTAQALQGYAFGLWPISLQVILVRAYLARGHTKIPTVSTIAALIITPLFALVLMGPPSSTAANALALVLVTLQSRLGLFNLGTFGVAISTAFGMGVAVLILLYLLHRFRISLDTRALLLTSSKALIASSAMSWSISQLAARVTGLTNFVLLAVPLGAAVYFLAGLLLSLYRLDEFRALRPGHAHDSNPPAEN
jgi:putative peptidoglycan lipid II flippase